MKKFCLLSLIIFLHFYGYPQVEDVDWASPSVEGMNLGKGIVFSYNRFSPYNVKSESQVPDLIDDASAQIQRIRSLNFKLRAPVLLKERTQIVIGAEYATDQFEFKNPLSLDYDFYKQLHHKQLRSRALKFYVNHSVSDRKFLFARSSIELNGDIPDEWYSVLRYTLSALYGWKISSRKSWGVGVYFSYNFGRPLLIPAIMYNVTWNSKWGLESVFPGVVMLRYRPNKKNILYLGYNVQGASYNINLGSSLNERFHNIQLRRSEITPVINYEREIYDFIWISVETGYRFNLNFNISEDNFFDEKVIIRNEVQSGTFIGASVFIVPTESLKALVKKKN